ncbi:MAG: hypothetical protein QW461_10790 [Candidatus Jordarchaeales archaeon]
MIKEAKGFRLSEETYEELKELKRKYGVTWDALFKIMIRTLLEKGPSEVLLVEQGRRRRKRAR